MESFLQTIAASALSAAVVAFLARSLLGLWLSKDLEAYKATLAGEVGRQTEILKADLSRLHVEHEVRFSHLHAKQAEVIAEVFGKLEQLHVALQQWTSIYQPPGAPSMIELGQASYARYNEFTAYYYPRAIWLDLATCESINALLMDMRDTLLTFGNRVDDQGFPKDKEKWHAAWARIATEVPKARALLDQRFRSILGVGTAVTQSGATGPARSDT